MWTGVLSFCAAIIFIDELQITATVVSDVAYQWWKAIKALIHCPRKGDPCRLQISRESHYNITYLAA